MTSFIIKYLDGSTWPDFARLIEKHNGVWGGCWCMSFHFEGVGTANGRSLKEGRVRDGRAHASMVYDGSVAVGWCQFGPTGELPRIKNKRDYLAGLTNLPDWRITCFFVDRNYRHKGIASIALEGALDEIARLGGGNVESYPEDTGGRLTSASFLYNGTVTLFERFGFKRTRKLGKNHWVVNRIIEPEP